MDWRFLLGYGHGMAWKLAALVSKLGFVLLVMPTLPDGVFSQYAFISSIALLLALVMSFGAMDALPTNVRGRISVQKNLAPLFQVPLAATCLAFVAYTYGGGLWALGAAMAGCSISYFFLSGVLRTTSPAQFEIVSNAPSILFLALALTLPALSIEDLLVLFFVANLAVMLVIGWQAGLLAIPGLRALRFSKFAACALLRRGNDKSLSNILMVADFRVLITAPNLLLRVLPSDAFAVALTVGEAFWQLAMVVVNRNYARYCAGAGSLSYSTATGLLLLGAIGLAGIVLIFVPIPIVIPRFDWVLIGWATVFFAAATALTELRAFYWSRAIFSGRIILAQSLIVLVQIVIIMMLPMSYWLPASAMTVFAATAVILLWARYGAKGQSRLGAFVKNESE